MYYIVIEYKYVEYEQKQQKLTKEKSHVTLKHFKNLNCKN